VLAAAALCEKAGALGITVHLREDRRHIQDADVYALRKQVGSVLNLEMANSPEIVDIALDVRPDEVCLVPEKREELTTEGGLDVAGQYEQVSASAQQLGDAGIEVSLFIDPEPGQIEATAQMGAPTIELHTGTYCDASGARAEAEIERLISASRLANSLGIKVNAGHGIHLENIAGIMQIPHLHTLNIGHSIVAHAVFVGLEEAVGQMLASMSAYGSGREEGTA
jgi:pyridoxine 5-phosphate synthase